MGQTGIEPATCRIFYRCSTSLSYCPILRTLAGIRSTPPCCCHTIERIPFSVKDTGNPFVEQAGVEPAKSEISHPVCCPVLCRAVTTPGTAGLSRLPSEVISSALSNLCLHPAKTCIRRGAGDGNRTRATSLEDWCSAIELHRHMPSPSAWWLTFKGCQL